MIELKPIGVVRSSVRQRKSMPPLGVPARIELFPEYAAGLLRLEKHSHIWVLAWLDAAERDVLQVVPRGIPRLGAEEDKANLHGVFAVRAPVRPNPVGLTVAKILGFDDSRIEVDQLDFLDGTPVIDLKPYFLSRDLIFSAANTQIGRPADRDALRLSLVRQAVNFHGEFCAGAALGVRLVEHFRAEVLGMLDPARWNVAVPLERACLVDALMGLTHATPGRGNLRFTTGNAVDFHCGETICSYELLVGDGAPAESILARDDAELFRITAGPRDRLGSF